MNRGINKVILIGYLGQEPEMRYMPNGTTVSKLSVATSRSWRDKQTNEFKEKTDWHRVVLFGKLAEIASEYLHKGSQIYVEGSLQTRKWKNKNGEDQYITEIIVGVGSTMQMLGNRLGGESSKVSDQSSKKYTIDHDDSTIVCEDDADANFSHDDIPF